MSIKLNEEQTVFLKGLQEQMLWEAEHENDSQAHPRFWVIQDCHFIPTNSDYADDHIYYHDDGDFTSLDNTKDLLYFIKDNYEEGYRTLINHFKEYHNLSDEKITSIVIEHYDFNAFWSFVLDELNENRYFGDKPVKKEWFIVPDTLFLTKNEAKEHLERYKGRYSAEAR